MDDAWFAEGEEGDDEDLLDDAIPSAEDDEDDLA